MTFAFVYIQTTICFDSYKLVTAQLYHNFKDFVATDKPTDPCPEVVGGVASAARVNLLAAAVRNPVIMQGDEPVVVVVHTATLPLCTGRREGNRTKIYCINCNLMT